MLQFLIKGSNAATVFYVMVVFLGSGFMDLMEVFLPALQPMADLIRTVSLRTQSPESVMAYAWALGMAWLTVSTIIGAISFQKKEIS